MSTNVYEGLVNRALQAPAITSAAVVVEQLKEHAPLESEEEAALVAGMGIACHDARVELERERKKILDPLNEARQVIFDGTKPRLDLFAEGERQAKALVGAWNEKKRAIALEEQRKQQERQAAAVTDGAPVPVVYAPPPSATVHSMGRTMHESTVWYVEVFDKAAAIAARPDLFDVRESDAKQLLQAGVVIPGMAMRSRKTQVIR